MWVVKNSGELEKFDPDKIKKTCINAGASEEVADKVAKEVSKKIYDGIKTKDILKIILKTLNKETPLVAARYDLKGAIFRLGPAGYSFERLIGEILKEYGYATKVHSLINGECVKHEIDVIAIDTNRKTSMIECKYHNEPGIYSGIKDILYTYARFLDLVEGHKKGKCEKFDNVWLVCNTRFSQDSIKYGECSGIKLLGWKYPADSSLSKLIEMKKLYPITMLKTLDKDSQEKMSKAGLILALDLTKRSVSELNRLTKIAKIKLEKFVEEAKSLVYF